MSDVDDLRETARRLLDQGSATDLDPETIQSLMALAVRAYAARFEAGEMADPVAPEAVPATEAALTCRGLLHAVDMELFELTLWGGAFPETNDQHRRESP